MGSEGYLINQFLAERTNDRDRRVGRQRDRSGCASRSRSCAAPASRSGPDFPIIYRISLLDLVEGGQTWDEVVELAQLLEEAGVDRLQHRHRLARGPGADDHHPGPPRRLALADRAAAEARRSSIPVCASNRINTPRARRGDHRRRPGRPGLDGPAAARRPRLRGQGRRRARRRDQHLHRLQPGLPGPRLREQAGLLPGQPARLPRDRARARPTRRAARGRRRRRRPGRSRRRGLRGRARHRGDAVRGAPTRSAASSASRWRCPARRSSPRRCATSRAGSRCSASTYASATDGHAASALRRRSTRWSIATGVEPRVPDARGRRPPQRVRRTPTCSSGAVVPGQAGRGDRRRRHRRRRLGLPDPRPGRDHRRRGSRTGASATPTLHRGGLTEPKPRAPSARSPCCSARPRRSARTSARRRAGRTARCSSSPGSRRSAGSTLRPGRRRRPALTRRRRAAHVLDVDHVVLCAGQESVRGLYDELVRRGRRGAPHRRRRRRRRARRQAGDRAGHAGGGGAVAVHTRPTSGHTRHPNGPDRCRWGPNVDAM